MTIILPEGTNIRWWKIKYNLRKYRHELYLRLTGKTDFADTIGRRKKGYIYDADGKKHKIYWYRMKFEPFRFDGPTYKDGLSIDKKDLDVLANWNWLDEVTIDA